VSNRVLGVLAGDGTDPVLLEAWARSADLILAADGGADLLLACGIEPRITIGDLDSLSLEAQTQLPDLRRDPDQNTSDCDKLLALASSLGHRAITLIGAEGSRLDHMVATLQSAARSGLAVRVVYPKQLAYTLVGPASLALNGLTQGSILSLLPLGPCQGVDLAGVRWPLQDETLDPLGLTSLSNEVAGDPAVSLRSGAAVLFCEYDGRPAWPGC